MIYSSNDDCWQSSDDEPETTTTINESADLSAAVAKANAGTERRRRLKQELRRAKLVGALHPVWKFYRVYVNTRCRAEVHGHVAHEPLHHVNTNLHGHRGAYTEIKNQIT